MSDNKAFVWIMALVVLSAIAGIVCQTVERVSKNKACQCSTLQTGGQK